MSKFLPESINNAAEKAGKNAAFKVYMAAELDKDGCFSDEVDTAAAAAGYQAAYDRAYKYPSATKFQADWVAVDVKTDAGGHLTDARNEARARKMGITVQEVIRRDDSPACTTGMS